MPTFRRIRRTVAAILLVLYLPACYHYVTPKGMTPQEYIAAKRPERIRLTLADGVSTELLNPWASADSLGGSLFLVPDAPGIGRELETPAGAGQRLGNSCGDSPPVASAHAARQQCALVRWRYVYYIV